MNARNLNDLNARTRKVTLCCPMTPKTLFLCLFILMAGCTSFKQKKVKSARPSDLNTFVAQATKVIHREMAKNKIVGLSIAMVDGQSVVWDKGFGLRNKHLKLPSNTNTVYRAGSISKLFTALAVMQLADKKRLQLDDSITKYLPDLQINSRFTDSNMTIRSLLTHHSGLPTDYIDGMWHAPQRELQSLIPALNQEYTVLPVNKIYHYSNIAFSLLGSIIERVSGQPYANYIETLIFDKLEMHSSNMSGELDLRNPNVSFSFIKKQAIVSTPTRDISATGINTTVSDLSKFIKWSLRANELGQHAILSKRAFHEMLAQQNVDQPLNFSKRMGLGWKYYDNYLGTTDVYGHDGRTIAQSALLLIEPKSKIGVVVLANSPSEKGGVYTIARELMRAYYTFKTQKAIIWRTKLNPSEPYDPPFDIAGRYATTLGLISIEQKRRKPNEYRVSALGRRFKLKPDDEYPSTYRLSYRLWGLFPIDLGWLGRIRIRQEWVDGESVLVGYSGTQKTFMGNQIKKSEIPTSWLNRLGRYYPKNNLQPEVFKIEYIELTRDNTFLLAHVKMKNGQALVHAITPISDTEAIVSGIGRSLGATLFLDQENHAGSAFRYLGVNFHTSDKN